jgi:riboflavin kinase/FMN adenylyltransferase
VEHLNDLRSEARCDGLESIAAAVGKEVVGARVILAGHAAQRRQTTRDRI